MQPDVSTIDLYQFPTGRRLVALGGVLAALDAAPTPEQREAEAPLRARVEAAIAHDQSAYVLEERFYSQSSRAEHAPEARPLDARIDRVLTALDTTLDHNMRAFPAESVIHQSSREVKTALLPRGATSIRNLEYAQEAQAVQILLNEADKAPLPEKIDQANVRAHIEELRALHTEFKAVLGIGQEGAVTFDKVRAARIAGQRNLLKIVAWVLGHYLDDEPFDIEARQRLLKPILDENGEIADEYVRYGAARDVDPTTGTPTGPTTEIS